jgi:hypothetical protein
MVDNTGLKCFCFVTLVRVSCWRVAFDSRQREVRGSLRTFGNEGENLCHE